MDVEGEEVHYGHFGIEGHKYIYMAMTYLHSKRMQATPFSIMEVLPDDKSKHSVEELGGMDYLMTMEEARISEENVKIYCNKIKQSYTRRKLYEVGEYAQNIAVDDKSATLNPSELIHAVETKIGDLSIDAQTNEDVYKMGDNTEAILAERAETPEQVPGLETGWTEFDRTTNGLQGDDLLIVVAESKTGKSVFLTNIATKFSIIDQIPILYIDTEMSARQQEDRILARLSGIPFNEIVSGMYVMDTVNGKAEDKVARLKRAREQLNMGNYYHVYMPQFTIEKVSALARKFHRQFGIKALFFDYIKIPSSQGSFKEVQEYQALGFLTSGLKDIAGMLDIPVLAAAQANRTNLGSDKKDASSIGGSYRILQLASKLMFLTNKTDEQIAKQGIQNGNQTLQIAYQRNGESGGDPINIFFDRPKLHMREV